MSQIFFDAFLDSIKMVPLLFLIYAGIEFLEYKYGEKLRGKVRQAKKAGPAVGALIGSVPQCGFSVISTALYSQRLITIGTLLAVYLSTSDEAVPILLSQPDKAKIVIPLILTKIIVGVIAGYLIDLFFRKSNQKIFAHDDAFSHGECRDHDHEIEDKACCGHDLSKNQKTKDLIVHPIKHTIKVFLFIFLASFLINLLVFRIGDVNLSKIFLGHSIFQPFLAAIIGLIPNCSASVFIIELFLKGAISYGSVIAGLCASAGLGLLVLFKENKNIKDSLRILGLLLAISIFVGVLIQFICG
ncbi:MAG: putative manganese transporter [Candidatus Paceibacterota bacterium]|jgi:hypothetical protein